MKIFLFEAYRGKVQMDLLTAIESESLITIQDIVLQKGLCFDATGLDYDALNKALVCKRKDVAMWLMKRLSCRVNRANTSNMNTPLHNAVKLGDMEIVEMLLKNKASITAVDFDNNTALHISFLYCHDKITDLLLGYIVENSNYTNKKNNQGLSHLHIACSRNNVKVIEGFLKAEANSGDIVKADSPSSWAGYSALDFALEFRSLEAAKVLLAAGSKSKGDENDTERSPLQLLHQHLGECMIMSDNLYKNALPYFHLACLKESATMVKKFIDKGADVNETIKWDTSLCNHYTPLHCAINSSYDRKEKVQLLLSHGATIEQAECPGKHNRMTALHMAFYNEYHMNDLDSTIVDYLYQAVKNRKENFVDQNKLNYFHIAVTRNDFDAVKFHLENGANVNQTILQNDRGFSGYSALLFALHYQLVGMAKFLIERGANVNPDEAGKHQTPLFKAFQIGNLSLIEFLIKSGARFDVSVDGTLGNTLLHYAAEVGNHELVQYLIDSCRYEVDVQNDFGETPLMKNLKSNKPCRKVVEILLKAGTDILKLDKYDVSALKIVDSDKWLIEDMERFVIYKAFLEKANDFSHFQMLEDMNKKQFEMLLLTGIDLCAKDRRGRALLHELILNSNSNPSIAEQLRGQNLNIDVGDEDGWTPLMYAVNNGISKTVELLLDEGANIEAAENDSGKTSLYIACYEFMSYDFDSEFQQTIELLLERGANVQTEVKNEGTIFDIVFEYPDFPKGEFEILLAHLALQEANGTAITQLIRSKINSIDGFKSLFENCKHQISVNIYRSVKLVDILTASAKKLERYLRNEEFAATLMVFQTTVDYFNTLLNKRLSKAIAMVGLRKVAVPAICKLMKIEYNRFPYIADEVVGYLDRQDLENLVAV